LNDQFVDPPKKDILEFGRIQAALIVGFQVVYLSLFFADIYRASAVELQ
jgi:hypothetical protein